MGSYSQTRCSKCTAFIRTDSHVCPFCGREQSAAPAGRQPAVRAVVPLSATPRLAAKSPSTPVGHYTPQSGGARKGSEAPLILGGIALLGAFIAFLVVSNHSANSPLINSGTKTIVSGAPEASTSPDSGSPTNTTAPVAAAASVSSDSDRPVEVSRADRVMRYIDVVDHDNRLLDDSMGVMSNAVKNANIHPQLSSDPNWKKQVTDELERMNNLAFALENIPNVPAECIPMQQKLQVAASDCNFAARDIMDGIMRDDEQECLRGCDKLSDVAAQFDRLQAEEKGLLTRYSN